MGLSRGGSWIFEGGGGDYVRARAHREREARSLYVRQGSRARLFAY